MGSDFEKKRQRNESGESSTSTDSVTGYIPTPPDGGWGWLVVLASFVNHVVVDGIAFTFGVFFIEFQQYFKSSKAQTALVGSLLAGCYLMSGPFASAMVNRFGCRAVCIAGALISSAGFLLATFSTSIEMLMVTYGVIGGFGFGLIYLPSIISVSYYFEKRRALATGIAVCGAGVGCFAFAPAGRMLMDAFDWKNGLFIISAVVLNCVVCGALMRPLEPPKKKKPRRKNFFDRLVEKHLRKGSRKQSEVSALGKRDAMVKAVQEAKLAREEALRDDDSYMEMSSETNSRHGSLVPSGGDYIYKPNNDNGGVPAIMINNDDKEDSCNDIEDGEKAKMLRKYSIDPSKLGSKAKIFTVPEQKRNSLPNNKGLISAIPPHMRKEILNGHARTLNGSLPDVKIQCVPEENTPLAPNGPLEPETTEKKSFSHADIQFLSIAPKKRKGVDKEDYARPLYRRDIFYSGSVLHIPQFRSQPDISTYVASITTIPDALTPEKESRCWRNVPLPKAAKDVLKQMLDMSLLKDPVFIIALLGEIFGFIGLFVPFVYVTERSIQLGIKDTDAAFLLSVIGITNTVGRVISGWLADFQAVSSLFLHNIMMIMGGVACILNMFATTYPAMITFCAFFGLSVATYISLTSIILCDIIGLERLTAAFGFLTLVRGLASVAGAPVAGYIFDLTGNYDWSFHVGGVMFIFAGGLYCLLHLPVFSKKIQRAAAKAQGIPLPSDEEDEVFSSPVIVVTEESGIPLSISDVVSDLPNQKSRESPSDHDDVDHQGNETPDTKSERKISFA